MVYVWKSFLPPISNDGVRVHEYGIVLYFARAMPSLRCHVLLSGETTVECWCRWIATVYAGDRVGRRKKTRKSRRKVVDFCAAVRQNFHAYRKIERKSEGCAMYGLFAVVRGSRAFPFSLRFQFISWAHWTVKNLWQGRHKRDICISC